MLSYILPAIIGGATSIFIIYLNNVKDKRDFAREHNYNQLTKLYLELYAIVIQSEYLRYFLKKYKNKDFVFWEFPFLEIKTTRTHIVDGKVVKEEIENLISEFNKSYLVDKVMENKKYASQKLLKLIVAYRYADDSSKKGNNDEKLEKAFQLEEVRLIYLIVKTINKECNLYLKNCNMPYDAQELSSGITNRNEFDSEDNYYY